MPRPALILAATKDQNTIAAFANIGGIRTSFYRADGADTRDITGPDATVDTTVRLKVDTGEAAAYAKPINRFMRDVKVVYFDVLSQMGLTKK